MINSIVVVEEAAVLLGFIEIVVAGDKVKEMVVIMPTSGDEEPKEVVEDSFLVDPSLIRRTHSNLKTTTTLNKPMNNSKKYYSNYRKPVLLIRMKTDLRQLVMKRTGAAKILP